jgi:enterochelin esterase-like enzyme
MDRERQAGRLRLRRQTIGMASLFLILALLGFLSACRQKEDSERLVKITLESALLKKAMNLLVWLPEGMQEGTTYPVLYFLPDYGGSAYTVINEYEIGKTADRLAGEGKIMPLIIAAISMDRSFGLNSGEEVRLVELASGKAVNEGPYEDYFVQEVMPLIEERFPVRTDREGHMIGGYSMGGYAALHIAFTYPERFSRVGGHSPSLFIDDFPDKDVSDWLYPDASTRRLRDPLELAKVKDLSGLSVYIDTGEVDVNIEGDQALADILDAKGIMYENHFFSGLHSRSYCQAYMDEYLLFYGQQGD